MSAAERAKLLRASLREAIAQITKDEIEAKLDRSALLEIGHRAIARMKQQISRGISPVSGFGRFPEYKSRSSARGMRQEAKAAAKAAKSATSKKKKTELRARAKALRAGASRTQRSGYPDSLGKKVLAQTGKKARPVNLKLYGDFLNHLEARVNRKLIEIGYFKESEGAKELGHREGANGQAIRPTIPMNSERFNAAIEAELLRAVDDVLNRRV